MAFAYSPKIVTDGLVFAVDAANTKSYPGSGTTWKDLSGNGNDGTLTNGPTFDLGNGGSIVFDGTDDYVDFGEFNVLSTNFTLEVWVKPIEIEFNNILTGGPVVDDSSPSYADGFYFTYDNRDGQNHLYIYMNGIFRQPAAESFDLTEGQFHQIGISSSDNLTKFFINGVEIDSTNSNGGLDFSTIDLQHLVVGARKYLGTNYVGANVSVVKIYNKLLSTEEISQNYNALKSRFGL